VVGCVVDAQDGNSLAADWVPTGSLMPALIGVRHHRARKKALTRSTQAEVTQHQQDDDNRAYKPDQSIHDE